MTYTSTMDPHPNFAISLVATAPSPAASGTSLVVTSGDGSRFPDPATEGPFNIAIHPFGELPTPDNAEICRVTARSSDTLTITRTQEGTSARAVVVGDVVYAAITKKTLLDAQQVFTITDVDYLPVVGSLRNWIVPGWGWSLNTTLAVGAGNLYFIPIYCSTPMTFDAIGARVVTGSAGSMRVGIYGATIESTQNRVSVGNLIVDAGTLDVTTSSTSPTVTLSPSVTIHGHAFIAWVCDSTPNMQSADQNAIWGVFTGGNNDVDGTVDHVVPVSTGNTGYVAGGLPSTFSAWTATATMFAAIIKLRMA